MNKIEVSGRQQDIIDVNNILKEALNAAVTLSLLLVRKCCMVHGDCRGGSDEARTHHPSSALPGDSLVTELSACLIESQSVGWSAAGTG